MRGSRVAIHLLLVCSLLLGGLAWAERQADMNPSASPPPDDLQGTPILPGSAPGWSPPEQVLSPEGVFFSNLSGGEKREEPTSGQDPSGGSSGHQEGSNTINTTTGSGAQNPAENTVVGVVGKVEVGKASGMATTEIPLHVPPGRGGLTPKVVLRYSSMSGPGPYGRGWGLELGHIQRSTRRGVPQYNDTDSFVLFLPQLEKGALLSRVELVNKTPEGALTRWIPQVEEAFLRVVQNVNATPSAEANTWEVWDKSGTKFVFGGTPPVGSPPGSVAGRVGKDITQASGTFGWYLTRIEDPNGNTLEITYLAVTGEAAGTYVYPSRIDYGANPGVNFSHKHHLVFLWETRPDLLESGSGGYLSLMSQRLQKITVATEGENGGLPFQTYSFGYSPSPNNGRQSLLTGVTRSSPTQSLPPVSLAYRDNSVPKGRFQFADTASSWTGPRVGDWRVNGQLLCAADQLWCKNPSTGVTRRKTIDLNGDGLADYVDTKDWSTANKKWTVYFNNGRGFDTPPDVNPQDGIPDPNWPAPEEKIQLTSPATNETTRDTLDLNGDGKVDYISTAGWSNTNKKWQVYWNRGDRFDIDTTPTDWSAPQPNCRAFSVTPVDIYTQDIATYQDTFDFNGDGKVDYVDASGWKASNESTQVWKVSLNQWPAQNGFATTEVLFPVSRKSGGSELLNAIRLTRDTKDGAGDLAATFDLTGDGLPEHVRVAFLTGVWSIYHHEGTKISHRADTLPRSIIRFQSINDYYQIDTFDLNHDGFPDQVDGRFWTGSKPYWDVFLGTGNLKEPFLPDPQRWRAPFQYIRHDLGRDKDVFDLDGDGLVDFVDVLSTDWNVWFAQGFTQPQKAALNSTTLLRSSPATALRPDLLEKIDNGLGGTVSLTYFPATVWPNSADNPIPQLPLPVWTVDSLTQSDGLGATHTGHFSYRDGLLDANDPLGIELRGFGWVIETDPLGNRFSTNFHQDPIKQGRPAALEVDDAAGAPIKDTFWTWEDTTCFADPLINWVDPDCAGQPGSKRRRLVLKQHSERLYAGASACEELQTFQDSFDGYGNVTASHTLGVTRTPCTTPDPPVTTPQIDTVTRYASHAESGEDLSTYYIVDRPENVQVYDSKKGLLQEKDFGYDSRGNPTRITLDPGPGRIDADTYQTYNDYGNLELVYQEVLDNQSLRNTATYTYDSRYQQYPETITNAKGHLTTQQFDARWGKLTSSKDPNGAEWQWSYDGFGRLLKEARPGETLNDPQPQKTLEYYPYTPGTPPVPNRVWAKLKEPNAPLNSYRRDQWSFFDGFGRLLQQKHQAYVNGTKTDIAGQTLRYNGRGEVAERLVPFKATGLDTYSPKPIEDTTPEAATTFTYDALGRLLRQTHPDPSFRLLTHSGFTTALVDEAGNRRDTVRDAYGRTVEERLYEGQGTLKLKRTYTYQGLQNTGLLELGSMELHTVTLNDNPNTTTSLFYDRLGRKRLLKDPDSGSDSSPGLWRYEYDKPGNLLSQTDPKGNPISFKYDSLDRIATKRYPNGSQIGFTYDQGPNGVGRLSSVSDLSGSSSFTYDARGNLFSKTQKIKGKIIPLIFDDFPIFVPVVSALTFNFRYDSTDRLTTTIYPAEGASPAETVTQTYNDTGQLTKVSSSLLSPISTGLYVSDIRYDLFGRQSRVLYGNGVIDEKGYHGAEKNFRLSSLRTSLGGNSYQNLSYADYDGVGNIRQINDNRFLSGDGRNHTESYTYDGLYRLKWSSGSQCTYDYDGLGNLNNKCGVVYTYSPSKPHQPTAVGAMSLSYDLNGNLVSKSGPTGYSATYNYDDRLEKITVGNRTSPPFGYDYTGRRVFKWPSGGGPVLYWDDLLELDGGIVRKHYFALGQRVATREHGGATPLLFYHPDHLGSPQVLTNESGDVVQYIRYRPYGEIRGIFDKNGTPISTPAKSRYLFTDKERDFETGLDYFGARFYDQEIALFLSHDPQAEFDSPYSYVGWNPVNLVDPEGEEAFIPSPAGGYYNPETGQTINLTLWLGNLPSSPSPPSLSFSFLDWARNGLDVIGLAAQGPLEPFGVVVDLASAGISLVQGDYRTAGLSGLAALPFLGATANFGKFGAKFGDEAADLLNAAKGQTEVVQRWMSKAELKATQETGLLRGGRGGTHYVTDATNTNALRARQRLALPQTPEVRVTLEVPKGVFSQPSRLGPAFNMPGGGMERTATGNIPVKILEVH